tara:strand:- start:94 stop:531 length:438 start_codon:yes stop_codon:yes gene_type:complete
MTVKTETTFYKNVKKLLEDGDEKFIVTRIESYATPGFPDCIIYHNDLGFFTIELKVVHRSRKGIGKVLVSPLQVAWHLLHVMYDAPVYILVYDPGNKVVNLFEGEKLPKLRSNSFDDVVPEAMYTGSLAGMQLVKLLSPQTPKLH